MKIRNVFGKRGSNLRNNWMLLVVMPCIFFAIVVLFGGCSSDNSKTNAEFSNGIDVGTVKEFLDLSSSVNLQYFRGRVFSGVGNVAGERIDSTTKAFTTLPSGRVARIIVPQLLSGNSAYTTGISTIIVEHDGSLFKVLTSQYPFHTNDSVSVGVVEYYTSAKPPIKTIVAFVLN